MTAVDRIGETPYARGLPCRRRYRPWRLPFSTRRYAKGEDRTASPMPNFHWLLMYFSTSMSNSVSVNGFVK